MLFDKSGDWLGGGPVLNFSAICGKVKPFALSCPISINLATVHAGRWPTGWLGSWGVG